MSSKLTISDRWKLWALKDGKWGADWWWSYSALSLMSIGFIGLVSHLWILEGIWRTVGLIAMIFGGVSAEAIMVYRKQWWWAGYWGICVLAGVSITELLSYFL